MALERLATDRNQIRAMPKGIPVGTLAVGKAGSINAALLAISILSLNDQVLQKLLVDWKDKQTSSVDKNPI